MHYLLVTAFELFTNPKSVFQSFQDDFYMDVRVKKIYFFTSRNIAKHTHTHTQTHTHTHTHTHSHTHRCCDIAI